MFPESGEISGHMFHFFFLQSIFLYLFMLSGKLVAACEQDEKA